MARKNGNDRESPRASIYGQPESGRSHSIWYRTTEDVNGCIEIHRTAPRTGRGYVYLAQDKKGRIKVGYTQSPANRLYVISHHVPAENRPLRIIRVVAFSDAAARRIEARLLSRLKGEGKHDRSDWFEMSVAYAKRCLTQAISRCCEHE